MLPGNLKAQRDTIGGEANGVSSVSGSLNRSFTYDENGNMVGSGYESGHGFDAENRLNNVIDVDLDPIASPSGTGLHCMDLTGDAVTDMNDALQLLGVYTDGAKRWTDSGYDFTYDIDWDGENNADDVNRIMAASGQTCETVQRLYTHDGNGNLLRRTEGVPTQPVDEWTVYIGGIYELKSDGTITKYYSAFGRSIAMSVNGTVHYLLGDHLGTTSTVVSETGAVEMERRYWPFGATRSETGPQVTDKLFTGQQKEDADPALGLHDYGARFYSTTLGTFLGADPIVGSPANPQAWNPYSYVRNNPLRYTDPSGLCVIGECPGDRARDRAADNAAAEDYANSGSIGRHRDTGCDASCQRNQRIGAAWRAARAAYIGAAWRAAADAYAAAAWTQAATIAQQAAANSPAEGCGDGGGGGHWWDAATGVISDKGADIKDTVTDVVNHPASAPLTILGGLQALGSSGNRRREDGVTIYENCSGLCSITLDVINPDAVAYTNGHFIFGEEDVQGRLLEHEKQHVRQADKDPLFPIKYLIDAGPYEEEARCVASGRDDC